MEDKKFSNFGAEAAVFKYLKEFHCTNIIPANEDETEEYCLGFVPTKDMKENNFMRDLLCCSAAHTIRDQCVSKFKDKQVSEIVKSKGISQVPIYFHKIEWKYEQSGGEAIHLWFKI